MTAAAAVLNLTQAAVSQQIKRLEEAFGAQLFERQRKGLQLTSAGERLFGRAKRLLALNDEIWAEMTTPLYEGEVRLGIPNDLVNTYLPTFLKSFAQTYPKVRISLECSTTPRLIEKLQAGTVDLTLTTEIGCGPDGESLLSGTAPLGRRARRRRLRAAGRCRSRSAATTAPSSRPCSRPSGIPTSLGASCLGR